MSIVHRVYVGPYLLVQNHQELVKSKIRSCTNSECPAHGLLLSSSKFCTSCGSRVDDVDVCKHRWISLPVDPDRLVEVDVSVSEGLLALISNYLRIARDGGRQLYYDRDDDPVIVEVGDVQQLEKSIFEKEFASEIEAIKTVLGEDSVRVTWGIVSYVS